VKKLGLIVNPIAGMGGAVGLKGTDGPELLQQARQLGAVPRAEKRTADALISLKTSAGEFEVLTYGNDMGESAVLLSGMQPVVVGSAASPISTPNDTQDAARALAAACVDLLLFTGGDGTARDMYDVLGTGKTTLGIPAGVKIQSAVFATNPSVAGRVASDYLNGSIQRTRLAEVLDIDEEAYRRGGLSAQLYGYLMIPDASRQLQSRKTASAPNERLAQQAIAEELSGRLADDRFYIVGPGTTCSVFLELLGTVGTLLGVDLLCGSKLVGSDMSERDILAAIAEARSSLIVTPVGGQGFLLGRGNQQVSAEVVRKVGKENIIIAATGEKLAALAGRPLLVDTGDPECDSYLQGYYRVVTGYREETVYRVGDSC
jgi:predicted polyphosphate/ATP-dependent NAD kinase